MLHEDYYRKSSLKETSFTVSIKGLEVIFGHNHEVEPKYNVRCVMWYSTKSWCQSHECQSHLIEMQASQGKWRRNDMYIFLGSITFYLGPSIFLKFRLTSASQFASDLTGKLTEIIKVFRKFPQVHYLNIWNISGPCTQLYVLLLYVFFIVHHTEELWPCRTVNMLTEGTG
jgi:hypothetical protein